MAEGVKSVIPLVLSLVLIGILVSVGVVLFTNLGEAAYQTVTVSSASFTMPGVNATAATIGGSGTNITTGSVVLANSTGTVLPAAQYSVNTVTGKVTFLTNKSGTGLCGDGQTCYASYLWTKKGSTTQTATSGITSAITPVTTTWLSLIVTVAVLAIVLGLVLMAFSKPGR